MTTNEIVGPLPTVEFHDGTRIAYVPPRDTLDPRHDACVEHRVGCDCREALLAEDIGEYRAQLAAAAQAAQEILAGHPIWAWEDGADEDREIGCMCTGCQIVRRSHLLPSYTGGPSARDEVDGLTAEQVAAGLRWKVCTSADRERFSVDCSGLVGRRRTIAGGGSYHEHLMGADGVPTAGRPADEVTR